MTTTGRRRRRLGHWLVLGLLALGFFYAMGSRAEAETVECDGWGWEIIDDDRDIELDDNSPDWFKEEARDEAGDGNCTLAEHLWPKTCEQMGEDYDDGVVPDACVGTYPGSNYNITYDGGGALSFDRKIWGGITGIIFNIGKTAVQVGMWLISLAFNQKLREMSPFSEEIAARYDTQVVGPADLQDLSWLILMAFVAWNALRGKIGIAAGEFLFSAVMIGLAAVLVGNEAGYMNALSDRMDEVSSALITAADPDTSSQPTGGRGGYGGTLDPHSVKPTVKKLQQQVFEYFVVEPYDYVNWGGPANLPGDCGTRAERIKAAGLTDDGGWSWRYMDDSDDDCSDAVAFNKAPTTYRFVGALVTTAVSIGVMFTLGLIAISLILGKFLLATMFAIAPFSAACAALPGTARRMAWSWVSGVIQCAIAVVLMSFLLSMMLIATERILNLTAETGKDSLLERWGLVLGVVAGVFIGRKRLLAASKNMGERMNDTLTRLSPAGANWAGGRGGGFDLGSADRGAMMAAAAPARFAQTRLAERRNAKRSFRNLERMERRREGPATTVTSRSASRGGGGGSGGGGSSGGGGGGGRGGGGRPGRLAGLRRAGSAIAGSRTGRAIAGSRAGQGVARAGRSVGGAVAGAGRGVANGARGLGGRIRGGVSAGSGRLASSRIGRSGFGQAVGRGMGATGRGMGNVGADMRDLGRHVGGRAMGNVRHPGPFPRGGGGGGAPPGPVIIPGTGGPGTAGRTPSGLIVPGGGGGVPTIGGSGGAAGPAPDGRQQTTVETVTKLRNPRVSDWRDPRTAVALRVRYRMTLRGHRKAAERAERRSQNWP